MAHTSVGGENSPQVSPPYGDWSYVSGDFCSPSVSASERPIRLLLTQDGRFSSRLVPVRTIRRVTLFLSNATDMACKRNGGALRRSSLASVEGALAPLAILGPGPRLAGAPLRGGDELGASHREIGEHRCEIVVAPTRKWCHQVLGSSEVHWSDRISLCRNDMWIQLGSLGGGTRRHISGPKWHY